MTDTSTWLIFGLFCLVLLVVAWPRKSDRRRHRKTGDVGGGSGEGREGKTSTKSGATDSWFDGGGSDGGGGGGGE